LSYNSSKRHSYILSHTSFLSIYCTKSICVYCVCTCTDLLFHFPAQFHFTFLLPELFQLWLSVLRLAGCFPCSQHSSRSKFFSPEARGEGGYRTRETLLKVAVTPPPSPPSGKFPGELQGTDRRVRAARNLGGRGEGWRGEAAQRQFVGCPSDGGTAGG